MNDPIPQSFVDETPAALRNPTGFYAAVNTHRLTLSHGWCPPNTVVVVTVTHPEHPELDLVFAEPDQVLEACDSLVRRLTDEDLLEILSRRWPKGREILPALPAPTAEDAAP